MEGGHPPRRSTSLSRRFPMSHLLKAESKSGTTQSAAAGVETSATEADAMPVERSPGVATKKQRSRDRVLYVSDMCVSNRRLLHYKFRTHYLGVRHCCA
jgi:hypothetical protein